MKTQTWMRTLKITTCLYAIVFEQRLIPVILILIIGGATAKWITKQKASTTN